MVKEIKPNLARIAIINNLSKKLISTNKIKSYSYNYTTIDYHRDTKDTIAEIITKGQGTFGLNKIFNEKDYFYIIRVMEGERDLIVDYTTSYNNYDVELLAQTINIPYLKGDIGHLDENVEFCQQKNVIYIQLYLKNLEASILDKMIQNLKKNVN